MADHAAARTDRAPPAPRAHRASRLFNPDLPGPNRASVASFASNSSASNSTVSTASSNASASAPVAPANMAPAVPAKSAHRMGPKAHLHPHHHHALHHANGGGKRRSATPDLGNVRLLRAPASAAGDPAPPTARASNSAADADSLLLRRPRSSATSVTGPSSPAPTVLRHSVGGSPPVVNGTTPRAAGTPPAVLQRPPSHGLDTLPAATALPPATSMPAPPPIDARLLDPVRYLPGTKAVKLVDRHTKMQPLELRKLLSEQPTALVVAAIGRPGTGKSMILSQLTPAPDQAFPTRSDQFPKTLGIDVHVAANRLILLDVQGNSTSKGVFTLGTPASPSPNGGANSPLATRRGAGTANGGGGGGKATNGTNSPVVDHSLDVLNVQITTWLLCVCDVVLVVAEEHLDREMVQCLKLAHELAGHVPGAHGTASILYVKNKVPPFLFTPSHLHKFAAFLVHDPHQTPAATHHRRGTANRSRTTSIDWTSTTDLKSTPTTPTAAPTSSSLLPLGLGTALPAFASAHAVHTFLVPDMDADKDMYPLPPTALVQILRAQILGVRRRGPRTAEVEWLRHAAQAWEFLKRSAYLLGE
ncbi:hypothetical protein GGF32_007062 [Allomyces javanicus]|nr:hypothetical protein GGF32_007062 [Allomyces javanicus]